MGVCMSSSNTSTLTTDVISHDVLKKISNGETKRTRSTTNIMAQTTTRDIVSAGSFNDRYKLSRRVLGKGAESTVYEGMEHKVKQRVAIKIMENPADRPETKENFTREVLVLSVLNHNHVIGLYDIFVEGQQYIQIFELAQGGSITSFLKKKGKLPEQKAKVLMQNLTGALHYVHSRGVIHRDIKCDNVLLRSDKNCHDIVIADFGFAVECWDDSLAEIIGTNNYMAPELLRYKYGKSVDVWALGVILFILLSGRFPFAHGDEQALRRMIKRGEYKLDEKSWRHVSDEAKDLIGKILVVEVEARYTTTQIMSHPWLLNASIT